MEDDFSHPRILSRRHLPPSAASPTRKKRSRSATSPLSTSSEEERETRRTRTTTSTSTAGPPSHSHHTYRRRRAWESSWSRRRVETEKLVQRGRLALVLDIDKTLASGDGNYDPLSTNEFVAQVSSMYDLYSKNSGRYQQQQQRTMTADVKGFDSLGAERSVIVVLQDNPHSRHWGGRGGLLQNVVLINDFYPANNDYRRRQIGSSSVGDGREDRSRLLVLRRMVSVLKEVHRRFFAGEDDVDVRDVISEMRKSTLRGCKIVITGLTVDPAKPTVEMQPLWKKAVSMGATCSKTVSDDVTHLVCFGSRWNVGDLKWALQNRKLVVGKEWLEAAFLTWSRPKEEFFSAHRS